eukprot:gene9016-10683_t
MRTRDVSAKPIELIDLHDLLTKCLQLEKQLVGNQEAFEQEPQGVHVNQQEAIQFQEDSETLLALLEESRQVLQDALLVWAPGLRSETAD